MSKYSKYVVNTSKYASGYAGLFTITNLTLICSNSFRIASATNIEIKDEIGRQFWSQYFSNVTPLISEI